jgi:hypothetical protein
MKIKDSEKTSPH